MVIIKGRSSLFGLSLMWQQLSSSMPLQGPCMPGSQNLAPETCPQISQQKFQPNCPGCRSVRWYLMEEPRPLDHGGLVQARSLPWVMPRFNVLGSNCLRDAIKDGIGFMYPRQLYWKYGVPGYTGILDKTKKSQNTAPHFRSQVANSCASCFQLKRGDCRCCWVQERGLMSSLVTVSRWSCHIQVITQNILRFCLEHFWRIWKSSFTCTSQDLYHVSLPLCWLKRGGGG